MTVPNRAPHQINTGPPDTQYNAGESHFCFLCDHSHNRLNLSSPFDEDDVAVLTKKLENLIHDWVGRYRVETAIDMIHHFYESQIQSVHTYLPEWSQTQIYNHIFFHTQQINMGVESTLTILQTQISAMNTASWEKLNENAPAQPDLNRIRTLQSLIRTYYDGIRLKKAVQ